MYFDVKPTNIGVPQTVCFSQHRVLFSFSFAQCITYRDTGAQLCPFLTFLLLLLQTASSPLLITDLIHEPSQSGIYWRQYGYIHKHEVFDSVLHFWTVALNLWTQKLQKMSCVHAFELHAKYRHELKFSSSWISTSTLMTREAEFWIKFWSKTPLHWAGAPVVAISKYYLFPTAY